MAESKKEYKKIQQTSEYNKKRSKHRYIEQIRGYQWGEGSGEGQDRGRGLTGTTIKYKTSYKDMLYNKGI